MKTFEPMFVAFVTLSGCGLGAESNFTHGLTEDRCEGNFPVCQTTAGCILGTGRYIRGAFPGSRRFIVPAPEESVIAVEMFFSNERSIGIDTEIAWHEPGCFDTHAYASEGRDIFHEAGKDRIFRQAEQVFSSGDHLVEIYSDAIVDYALRISVESKAGRQ